MKERTETRYNQTRLRAFTIWENHDGSFTLRLMSGKQADWPKFIKTYKPAVYSLLLGHERFYHNVTKKVARQQLNNWRKRCTRDGLINIYQA